MGTVTNFDAERRRRRRDAQKKRQTMRLLFAGVPVLALLLLAGWYTAPSLSMPERSEEAATVVENEISQDSVNKLAERMSLSGADAEADVINVTVPPATDPVADVEPVSSQVDSEDWRLLLVNPWNYIPEGYDPTLTQLMNGHSIDERAYPDLQDMMDACRADGNDPLICSSYRSMEKQTQLFENRVASFIAQGYSEADARTEAATINAIPGTSEHQLGLAVDIVDVANQNLDKSQEDTAVQKWLMENSWKYGFILRYPADKSELTGIIYEPWHYRYVGKTAAKEIFEQGVCLEEYLA